METRATQRLGDSDPPGVAGNPRPLPAATRLGLALLLALLCTAPYLPAVGFELLNYDDDTYVTSNDRLHDGLTLDNVVWSLRTFHFFNWHPQVWLSYMLDADLWGVSAATMHATNLVLHAIAIALLLWWLLELTPQIWPAVLAAAWWGLHPLRVESVAWVSERKGLLAGVWLLMVLIAYTHYARRTSPRRYALVALCLAIGLTAKPVLVSVPVVLLVLDVWPLRRVSLTSAAGWWRCLVEKLPLLSLALVAGVLTIFAQHAGGAIADLQASPLHARLANAVWALGEYIRKTIWPTDLAIHYPWNESIGATQIIVALVLVGVPTALAIHLARRGRPQPLVVLTWFLLTLLPTLGLIRLGSASMADRYTHVPHVGLAMGLCLGLSGVMSLPQRLQRALLMATGLLVLLNALLMQRQLQTWRTSETVFTQALRVTRDNALAHTQLAGVYLSRGDRDAALRHLQTAFEIRPESPLIRANLGAVLAERDPATAVAFLLATANDVPQSPDVQRSLGQALLQLNHVEAARQAFQQGLALQPDHVGLMIGMAEVARHSGDREMARLWLQRALQVDPANMLARRMLDAVPR